MEKQYGIVLATINHGQEKLRTEILLEKGI
jgi:hypothetical protein